MLVFIAAIELLQDRLFAGIGTNNRAFVDVAYIGLYQMEGSDGWPRIFLANPVAHCLWRPYSVFNPT